MFPNGNTAMDDRVMASAFTDSETTSSSRDTSRETGPPAGMSPDATLLPGTSRAAFASVSSALDGLNIADEPEAALVQRANKSLVGSVVTKRAPGAIDAAGEGGLGDDPAIPDRLDQFILADNPVTVAHQVNDEIEDLRLDVNGQAKPAQLLLAEVDLELGKPVLHFHLC